MKLNKKWLFIPAGLLIPGLIVFYLVFPSELVVTAARVVRCNASAAMRVVSDPDKGWAEWWPGVKGDNSGYRIRGHAFSAVAADLKLGRDTLSVVLNLLTVGVQDSTELLWQYRIKTDGTPWSRWEAYRRSRRIEGRLRELLVPLGDWLEKNENLYGMDVKVVMSKDSTLISMPLETAGYPSVEELYGAIHELRKYIADQGAREVEQPMLSAMPKGDGRYTSKVAIPVDRELKGTKSYLPMRFVPWKVLTGEVRGGASTAENAIRQLHLYVVDHQYTEMAMSFQRLVTERDRESDTSRWVTRVITPVP